MAVSANGRDLHSRRAGGCAHEGLDSADQEVTEDSPKQIAFRAAVDAGQLPAAVPAVTSVQVRRVSRD